MKSTSSYFFKRKGISIEIPSPVKQTPNSSLIYMSNLFLLMYYDIFHYHLQCNDDDDDNDNDGNDG